MAQLTAFDVFQSSLDEPWVEFGRRAEAHRADLFSFALELTGGPFAAEELVRDALTRGLGSAAVLDDPLFDLRAHLMCLVATNWIGHQIPWQPAGSEPVALDRGEPASADVLHPWELVASLLDTDFGFGTAEVAAMLATTPAAVRSAADRASTATRTERTQRPRVIDVDVVDQTIAAFAAADRAALRPLLLDNVVINMFPYVSRGASLTPEGTGWVSMVLAKHDPEPPAPRVGEPSRFARVDIGGVPAVVVERGDGEERHVEDVWLIETVGDQVAVIHDYGFAPEVLDYVGGQLGIPARPAGYRFGCCTD